DTVVAVWATNPDFPHLTIVQSPTAYTPEDLPGNVGLLAEHLPGPALQILQNASGVHVCPSEAEGWGDYLVEGLSVGAHVLTPDAQPLNELVTPERGILCSPTTTASQRLGTNHYVSPETLEAAVRSTLARDPDELVGLGRGGRAFFVENDRVFRSR